MGLKRTIRSSCFSIKNYHQDQIILFTTHWYSSDFELGSLKSLRSNCFKVDKSLSSSKGLLWLSVSYLKSLVKNWGERGQRKTRMTSPPGIFPLFRSTLKKSFFWEKNRPRKVSLFLWEEERRRVWAATGNINRRRRFFDNLTNFFLCQKVSDWQ